MPRQPRMDIAGVPQHVMMVGVGDTPVFTGVRDCRAYLEHLYDASRLDGCAIHAYALASARAQLVVTGCMPGAVARMMRRLGLGYARYANARDGRRGACWRGRYLSCPVGGHRHILLACGHVERVAERLGWLSLGDRSWSSHACNAHGSHDRLVSPHPAYAGLGNNPSVRHRRYLDLVEWSREIDAALTMHTRQGRAWGSTDFLRQVAAVLGVQQPARPPGRPRKTLPTACALSIFFLSPFLLTGWMPVVETL